MMPNGLRGYCVILIVISVILSLITIPITSNAMLDHYPHHPYHHRPHHHCLIIITTILATTITTCTNAIRTIILATTIIITIGIAIPCS